MWALRALLLAIFARYLHVNHNFFAPPAAVIDAPHTSCLASPVEPGLLMKTQHYFKGQLSSVGAPLAMCLLMTDKASTHKSGPAPPTKLGQPSWCPHL